MPDPAPDIAANAVTEDSLLGGGVILHQPAKGYRVAIDPVFLAAAVAARAGESLLELGCGTGAASLCLAHRVPQCRITALERDPAHCALARKNIGANNLAGRIDIAEGDLRDHPALGAAAFDQVFANPPYMRDREATPPASKGRQRANMEGDTALALWIGAMLDAIAEKGRLTLIHRADRLGDILGHLSGRAGDIIIFPLWPKLGADARRVIVTGRKGVAAPARLAAGLVLHHADGRYTEAAEAVLRGGEPLVL